MSRLSKFSYRQRQTALSLLAQLSLWISSFGFHNSSSASLLSFRWKTNSQSMPSKSAAFSSSSFRWQWFAFFTYWSASSSDRANSCTAKRWKLATHSAVLKVRVEWFECWVSEQRTLIAFDGTADWFSIAVAVVVTFFLCWAPFHAQRIMAVYGKIMKKSFSSDDLFMRIYIALTYISGISYFLSTCINPFLYNIMSAKFRNASKVSR